MRQTIQKRKLAQLGLAIGTASSRLRKRILFALVCELERNICYRCGRTISVVEELTVDHKEPWLDVSTDLFWDLANVAFSHSLCNTLARKFTAGMTLGPIFTSTNWP